jgi:hypothetical protein
LKLPNNSVEKSRRALTDTTVSIISRRDIIFSQMAQMTQIFSLHDIGLSYKSARSVKSARDKKKAPARDKKKAFCER